MLALSPRSIDLASAPIEDVAAAIRTTLTEQGALQRVRATLRAHVYSALMASEPRPAAPNLAATSSGKLALAVIDDFLQFHSLESTASTAAVEVIGWSERSLVADAAAELRLPHSQQPLLLQLLEAHLAHAGDAAAGKTAAARRPPVIVAPAPAAPAPLAAAPASPVAALEPAEPPSAASSPLSSSAASMADSVLSSSGGGGSVGGGGARARGSTLPPVGGGGGAGGTGKLLPSLAPLRARDNSGASAEDEWVRDRRLEDEEREAARRKVAAEEAERERAAAAKAAAEAEAKAAAEAKAKSDEVERKAAEVKRLLAEAEEAKKAEDEKMSARVSGRGMGGGGSLWGEDEKLNAPSSGRRAGGGGGLDAFMAKETEKQQVAERRGATGMGGLDAFMKRQQAASGVSAPESDVLGGGAAAEAPSTSLFTGAAGGARGLPPPVDGRRAPVLSKPGGTEGKPTAARGAAAESELKAAAVPNLGANPNLAANPNLGAAPNLERSNVSNAAKHAAALAEDSDASIELAGETDDDEDNVGLSRSMGSVGSINSSPGSAKGRVSGVGALGTALTGSSAVAKPRSAFALAAESDDEDDGTVLGPVRAAKSATAPAKRHAGPPDTAPKPAFRFDDEPKPKAVYKAPPPPQPTIDDEPAEEVDDIEVISDLEIEDDGGDAW